MVVKRERMERALEAVRAKLADAVAPGEPGAVVLVSSRGEPAGWVASGVESLESRKSITTHTIFDVGSVAKAVTGLAVAILEEEGTLSSAADLRDVLPELPPYVDGVRVEHLLHHESGLRNYFGLLYYRAGWHPRLSPSSDEAFAAVCRVGRLAFPPGTRYAYCDTNYLLLARIIERLAGRRFGEFAWSRIFAPLGMNESYISDAASSAPTDERARAEGYVPYAIDLESPFALRAPGAPRTDLQPVRLRYDHVGAEGFYASAADLALLAKHILFPSLVSPETLRGRLLAAPRVRDDGLGYGYGLNVGTYRGRRFIGHDGAIWGYSASVAVFPDDDLEVVCLTNRDDVGAWNLRSAVLDALDISDPRSRRPSPPPPAVAGARIPPDLKGAYLDATSLDFLEIVERDGGLAASLSGGPAVGLVPGENGALCAENGSLTIRVCGDRSSLRVETGEVERTFERFARLSGRDAFRPYEGTYVCDELATTFDVAATETGVRLRNRDRRRPSMDLDYTPTLRDLFWSRDPYVELIQLRFLRERGAVRAFVYGDTEDLLFVRKA